MPASRWMLSALIVFHVTAVTLSLLPRQNELRPVEPRIGWSATDGLARRLTPLFDGFAARLAPIEQRLYDISEPVRLVTQPYVNIGIRQRWRMFASPPTDDRYLRLRYYVSDSPQSLRAAAYDELVLPVADGESLRYFRGKAIRNALNGYLEKKLGFVPIDGVDDPSNSLVYRDLVPLVRYFRARFERNRLHSEEKVIRTELWFGSAPIPPRGQRTEVENLARRATALGAYREKRPSEVVLYQAPPEGTVRQEVDIQWRLEFVVTPQSPS